MTSTAYPSGILCPSTDTTESTHLLGLRGTDGKLTFLNQLLPVPAVALEQYDFDDFRDKVRMTGVCIQGNCMHWQGFCNLGRTLSELSVNGSEQTCPITTTCRWRIENGSSICSVCPQVMRQRNLEDLEDL